jgi:type II secretory pathway component PulL
MKLSRAVMNDLLTVYLAGEASAETQALVEQYAREDVEFAAAMEAAAQVNLESAAPKPGADVEIRSLKMTRQFVRLRSLFMAMAIFFTLLPFSFAFSSQTGMKWLVWETSTGLGLAFLSVALASWIACYLMNREVKRAGL